MEFEDIKNLVKPGSRKRFQARAKLRPFAIIEASLSGRCAQPAESELRKFAERVREVKNWRDIFPGIRRLRLSTDGEGINVTLRITKSEGEPVHLVREGTLGATTVAVKRVDQLGFYSLNVTTIARKVNMSVPKTLAVIKHLKLQDDPEYFKEFIIGSCDFKRYSWKALDRIKKDLPNLDMQKVWNKYKRRLSAKEHPVGGGRSA